MKKEISFFWYALLYLITSASSYTSSSANHKGNISLFDTYKTTGKFNNTDGKVITYNGVRYVVNNDSVLTLILKKN